MYTAGVEPVVMLGRVLPDSILKGRYRLDRFPLRHKGLGEVWRGYDTRLDRPVIVKFINAALLNAELVRRFRREALLTARLDHPGVPAIYDFDERDGQPYLVIQLINGDTLDDLIHERGPLSVEWVATIGAQVASVLVAAERVGLVHRDIKPSNVMIDRAGAVKVLDFGLAAIHGDDRYSRITETGQSLGTVGYMAPEQVFGDPTDHRTDLYGLGTTLFHLLTGDAPFDGVTTTTTLRRQMDHPPPRPAELRPEIPAVLDELVAVLMAFHPDDRPGTAAEVYDVLAPLALEPPPIVGLIDETADAVQRYCAIVGRVPPQRRDPAAPAAKPAELDLEQAVQQADQLYAAGERRAAIREWRRLAGERAKRHGDDDPLVFDLRLRAARAHLPLGEHRWAVRQLNTLLEQRVRADGPEHPAVRELRQEIARLNGEQPASPQSPSGAPGSGH